MQPRGTRRSAVSHQPFVLFVPFVVRTLLLALAPASWGATGTVATVRLDWRDAARNRAVPVLLERK